MTLIFLSLQSKKNTRTTQLKIGITCERKQHTKSQTFLSSQKSARLGALLKKIKKFYSKTIKKK